MGGICRWSPTTINGPSGLQRQRRHDRFGQVHLAGFVQHQQVAQPVVIAAGRFATLPPGAGIVMILVGALDFAFVPLWLARKWRTPR